MTADRDLLRFVGGCLFAAAVLLLFGRLDGAQWIQALQWSTGVLVAGKVAGPVGEGIREQLARKSSPT